MDTKEYLNATKDAVDAALEEFLPGPEVPPQTLHKALRHSMFAGGKRLRPILCLAAAEACNGTAAQAMPLACSVECIHTYSLIHDDLPCMDDDDFRRGNPTCHKVFGDNVAVLTGDAMQALAFEICAKTAPSATFSTADYVTELAITSGSFQLIAGQVMDVEGEGRTLTRDELEGIHLCKTAALLTTSLRFGGMAAGASSSQIEALTIFGRSLGLAFQVIDDILDVTQTSETLGKSAGKDVAAAKATYPSILGLDASRTAAAELTEQANAALDPLGPQSDRLRAIGNYLLAREY